MVAVADRRGRACLGPIAPGVTRSGYTILRIETLRAGHDYAPVLVHLALDRATGTLRPIGIHR
jgi:hypothetical protein